MHPGFKNIIAGVGCPDFGCHCIRWQSVLIFLVALGAFAPGAYGQVSDTLDAVYDGAGLDQKLGEEIPLDLVFVDEQGTEVTLAEYFDADKPVILTMVYHSCPMLCNLLLDGFTETLSELDWTAGQEFEMLSVSISPDDTPQKASEKKAFYLEKLKKSEAGAGWHFLTGSQASIHQLTDAIGFRYNWVEEIQQFAHPPIVTILTPEGKVSRYLQGITFNTTEIRLALVEASDGEIGSPIDFITLFCLQYDPETNAYVAHAANLMKLGGALTVLVLGLALFVLWRREGQSSPATS